MANSFAEPSNGYVNAGSEGYYSGGSGSFNEEKWCDGTVFSAGGWTVTC
jgi:hypothetical protein